MSEDKVVGCRVVADKVHSPSYSQKVYDPTIFPRTVHQCIRALKAIEKEIGKYDFIAGVGNSALPLLGAIGFHTGLPYVAVRKKGDASHDERLANGPLFGSKRRVKYVFVDDLISTGTTYYHCLNTLRSEYGMTMERPPQIDCVATVLYDWANKGEQRINRFEMARADANGMAIWESNKLAVDRITVYHAHFFD